MGKYAVKNYLNFDLFIGDNGFYLEDKNGKTVLDASMLDYGTWPIEIEVRNNRDYYIQVNTNLETKVSFGISQVKSEN